MTDTKPNEEPKRLELNGVYWAINAQSDIGIPAVELDLDSGKHLVLFFSSPEAAQKFCYLKNPEGIKNLYQLQRTARKDEATGKIETVQVGLIKIARRIEAARMTDISDFVLDHPGGLGPAMYVSVKDMAQLGRKAPPKDAKPPLELSGFLNSLED